MPTNAYYGPNRGYNIYPALPTSNAGDYGLQGFLHGGNETTSQLASIAELTGYLAPYFNNLANQNVLPASQYIQGAASASTRGQLEDMDQLYNLYGQRFADTAGRVQTASQKAAAQANADTLNSVQGRSAINAALGADQLVNPEYYNTRSLTSGRLADLMNSYDLSGNLSGSEQRAIGQSLAQQGVQTGTANIPSQSQTVANAMQYGNAATQRKQQAQSGLSEAISKATSFMPASNNPNVNAWSVGTGTQGSNLGGQLFSSAYNTGNNIASTATNQANNTASLYATGAGVQTANNQIGAQAAASNSNSNAGMVGSIIGGLGGLLALL